MQYQKYVEKPEEIEAVRCAEGTVADLKIMFDVPTVVGVVQYFSYTKQYGVQYRGVELTCVVGEEYGKGLEIQKVKIPIGSWACYVPGKTVFGIPNDSFQKKYKRKA